MDELEGNILGKRSGGIVSLTEYTLLNKSTHSTKPQLAVQRLALVRYQAITETQHEETFNRRALKVTSTSKHRNRHILGSVRFSFHRLLVITAITHVSGNSSPMSMALDVHRQHAARRIDHHLPQAVPPGILDSLVRQAADRHLMLPRDFKPLHSD